MLSIVPLAVALAFALLCSNASANVGETHGKAAI